MDVSNQPTIENAERSGARHRIGRPTMAVGALLLVGLLTVGAIATAGQFGFGHHGDPERMREHVDFVVERMLRAVDASEEQAEQIQGIADAALVDLDDFHTTGRAIHEQFAALLTAERIDREELEALRQEQLASIDAASGRIVQALADVSEVLTPAQRTALAQHIEERRARRHHRPHWDE
jgi:Spy/CpxP family protein refolding chaperone